MTLYQNGLNMTGDTLADRPATAVYIGTVFVDGSNGNSYYWNGASWNAVPGGGGGGTDPGQDSHVISSNTTIAAGKAAYITRYVEINSGIILELALNSDLEIG